MNLSMKSMNYHPGCLNYCETHVTTELELCTYLHFDDLLVIHKGRGALGAAQGNSRAGASGCLL